MLKGGFFAQKSAHPSDGFAHPPHTPAFAHWYAEKSKNGVAVNPKPPIFGGFTLLNYPKNSTQVSKNDVFYTPTVLGVIHIIH